MSRAPASHATEGKRVPGLPIGEQEATFRAPAAHPGSLRKQGLGDLPHLGPHQKWAVVARSPKPSGMKRCLSFPKKRPSCPSMPHPGIRRDPNPHPLLLGTARVLSSSNWPGVLVPLTSSGTFPSLPVPHKRWSPQHRQGHLHFGRRPNHQSQSDERQSHKKISWKKINCFCISFGILSNFNHCQNLFSKSTKSILHLIVCF